MTNQEFGQFYSRLRQFGTLISRQYYFSGGFDYKFEHWKLEGIHYVVVITSVFMLRITAMPFL